AKKTPPESPTQCEVSATMPHREISDAAAVALLSDAEASVADEVTEIPCDVEEPPIAETKDAVRCDDEKTTDETLVAAIDLEVAILQAGTAATKTRSRGSKATPKRLTAGVPVSGPNDMWRGWALALSNARGAQPLGTFERLFTESYIPLANAI